MRKHIFRMLGTILLVTAVVLTQIPPSGINAVSPFSNGFMMDGDKLVKYTGTATSVSVPDGVKTIGAEAFADCTSLSYITLPSSLQTIESGAFSGCTYLNRLIVPEGTQEIGNGAFADCKNLSSVTLPSTLLRLGTSTFAGCEDLKTISVSKNNPHFVCEDGVLYDEDKTIVYQVLAGRAKSSYMMPNTVNEIKKYAFWGCENLEEVGLSSRLEQIDDYAFSNASGLQKITLPYSVRSIGTKAFEDCRNLTDTVIPVSVTRIDPTAFDGCYQLNVIADEKTAAADFFAAFEKDNASRAEYEENQVQNTNPHLEEDTAHQHTNNVNVSDVEQYVEWDIDSPGVLGRTKVVSRQAVVFMDTAAGTVYDGSQTDGGNSNESAAAGSGSNEQTVSDNADEAASAIVNANAVAYKAFYQNASLSNYTFPSGVTQIMDFAFARSGLTDIRIPNGVQTIGTGAFYHCDNLATVSIPASVTEIEPEAFTYTKWLQNWHTGSDVNEFLVVGDGILLAYKGNASTITLPSNIKRIAPGVFQNHTELTQVTLPDSLKVVGEEAFAGCSSLRNIAGGSRLEEIRDRAFYGCPIDTVRIPATVQTIGLLAFGGTNQTDCVVFLGDKLPKVSYEKSAARLLNDSYRGDCLEQISVAVVKSGMDIQDMEGSVLDPKQPGFSGQVYVLNDNVNEPKAEAVMVTVPENEADLPEQIYVYQKAYPVITTQNTYYLSREQSVSDNSIQGLMVVDHPQLEKADVELTANGSTVNLDGYHFYLSGPGKGEALLKEKIEAYYGNISDENCFMMDLSLYDPTDTIPIKKLGKNTITVTLPVPPELLDDEVCVVGLDENEKPEVTFCTWLEKEGKKYVSFEVSHFSPYALYGAEGELKEKITEKRARASYAAGLDETPDTGDYLDVKMILSVGIAALGAFFLLFGFTKPLGKSSKKRKIQNIE